MRSITLLAFSTMMLTFLGCADNGADTTGNGGSDTWPGGGGTSTTTAHGGAGGTSTTGSGGGGGSSSTSTGTSTTGAGGSATTSTTSATTGNTTSGTTTGATTTSGTTTTGGACTGEEHTLAELTNGSVQIKTKVQVQGVVAMSRKFLVSGGKTGGDSCLWGVYVSAPGLTTTAPHSGILAVGYGDNVAAGATACAKLADGPVGGSIPDDTKPGDVLTLGGQASAFLPSTCGQNPDDSDVKQYQLGLVTCAHKTGTAAIPAPYVLSSQDLDKLGGQTDKSFYDAWGGVKVRLESVTAVNANAEGGVNPVGAYGNITLEEGSVQVGDKMYYVKGSSAMCDKGPKFGALDFDAIEGFVALDFCKWSLQVPNKCTSFTPKSFDCGVDTCE
jgi:hypothetical protein